jgi:hypothetical protein
MKTNHPAHCPCGCHAPDIRMNTLLICLLLLLVLSIIFNCIFLNFLREKEKANSCQLTGCVIAEFDLIQGKYVQKK